MNIYEKLQLTRTELQKLNLKKGGKNAFANFNYYQLDDFIPPLNELLLKNKLTTNFSIIEGVATLEIVDIEKVEDKILFQSPIASADIKGSTPIQCLGGIHTYMKRYLYQNAFEIVELDILDALVGSDKLDTDKKEKEQKKSQNAPQKNEEKFETYVFATKNQIDFINNLGDTVVKWALKKFQVFDLSELSQTQANYIINSYQKKQGGNQ